MSKQTLIDTPCGWMTRKEAAALSGLAYKTIVRRAWEGWPVDMLFVKGQRPCVKRREGLRGNAGRGPATYSESSLTMPYAEFKALKQRERADAKLQRDLPRKIA